MKKHERILEIIKNNLNIDIENPTRLRPYVDARSIFYWLCYHYTDLNVSQIARLLNKNHATILHSIKNFPDIMKYDLEFKEKFDKIHTELLSFIEHKKQDLSLQELVNSRNYLLLENEALKKSIDNLRNQNEQLKNQIIHGK